MSDWIRLYSKSESGRKWLMENYKSADELFRKIHPSRVHESPSTHDLHVLQHGIESLSGGDSITGDQEDSYYWKANCHWNSNHSIRTERDLIEVLKKLNAPPDILFYHSL